MNSSNEHPMPSIYSLGAFPQLSSPISTIALYFCLAILPWFIQTLYNAYATPLRGVPGPWLAKFTRIWLFRAINSRKFERINLHLHQKYGPVVRIAPNEYSIDDPEAANVIYRPRDQLPKVCSTLSHLQKSNEQTRGLTPGLGIKIFGVGIAHRRTKHIYRYRYRACRQKTSRSSRSLLDECSKSN